MYKDYNNIIFLWPASMTFFVICSAFLYLLASCSTIFFWCSFLFLMPLLYIQKKVAWYHGFLWGIVVFGIHFAWMFELIITRGTSFWWIFAWVLLLGWYAMLSSLWFVLFKKSPIISTIIFFTIINFYSLCIVAMNCAYPLCNPLLYLPEQCWYFLPWIGEIGLLFCMVALQVWIFKFPIKCSWSDSIKIWICSFIFLFGLSRPALVPADNHTMIGIHPWWYGCDDAMYAGYRMAHDLCVAAQKNAKASCIVLPESCFCWDIMQYSDFITIWSQSCNNIPLLFGGHCKQAGSMVNAAFLVHDDCIVYQYHKQHYMPCVEQSLWIEKLCNRSILTKEIMNNVFVNSNQDDTVKIDGVTYQLFICSEFFCQAKKVKGLPILLLWNDAWLCNNFTKRLAYRYILYCQYAYRVPILHVSTLGHSNI